MGLEQEIETAKQIACDVLSERARYSETPWVNPRFMVMEAFTLFGNYRISLNVIGGDGENIEVSFSNNSMMYTIRVHQKPVHYIINVEGTRTYNSREHRIQRMRTP